MRVLFQPTTDMQNDPATHMLLSGRVVAQQSSSCTASTQRVERRQLTEYLMGPGLRLMEL